MTDEFEEIPATGDALVGYRLGRLEKAVEFNNQSAMARDDKILVELKAVSMVVSRVSLLEFRIEALDTKLSKVMQFVGALALVILGAVLSFLFTLLR